MSNRTGKGVDAQSLIGPDDETSGVLPYRLCQCATRPGRFTVTGGMTAYEDAGGTEARSPRPFRLRKRNR